MKLDEAIDTLEAFCSAGLKNWDNCKVIQHEIQATAVLIYEYKLLRKRLVQLEIESVNREKELTKLELEVEQLRDIVLNDKKAL